MKSRQELDRAMEEFQRVYVPTVIETEGPATGMGMFSTEETAWHVLRAFLKKSSLMDLKSASVVAWDVDVVGQEAMTILAELECMECPVCKRKTFWVDIANLSALCHGNSCEAWIEESMHEEEKIDCGFPQTQFLKQTRTIKEAFTELAKIAVVLESAGRVADSSIVENQN